MQQELEQIKNFYFSVYKMHVYEYKQRVYI